MDILRAFLKMKAPGQRKPDFERFRRAITSNEPVPVPVGDLFADYETVGNLLMEPIWEDYRVDGGSKHTFSIANVRGGIRYISQNIRFCCLAGWDYVPGFSLIPFERVQTRTPQNTESEGKEIRDGWVENYKGPIMNWDDFECYPWPENIKAINVVPRSMAKLVPDGMKVMVIPGGVFEWTTWLMGLVPFSYALAEQPDLVDAVIEKVTMLIYRVVEDILREPNVGGVFMGDDLGYFTGTMVSPKVLRDKFLPRTKTIVELTHQAGGVFVLHSCGNIYEIMDDIVAMGVDAKNSFEDKIMPVEQAHTRWGHKIGMVGGVDVGLLTQATQTEVRARTRQILDACAVKGRYVLGTGNSVASYIPLVNYQAMLDEGRLWNLEHFGREY